MIHYGGRLFRVVSTEGASQTTEATIFKYEQTGSMVIATYAGGDIRFGHLLGHVSEDGSLDVRYHHIDHAGQLCTGTCQTVPTVLSGGRLRLNETWQWTSGDKSFGTSVLEEI